MNNNRQLVTYLDARKHSSFIRLALFSLLLLSTKAMAQKNAVTAHQSDKNPCWQGQHRLPDAGRFQIHAHTARPARRTPGRTTPSPHHRDPEAPTRARCPPRETTARTTTSPMAAIPHHSSRSPPTPQHAVRQGCCSPLRRTRHRRASSTRPEAKVREAAAQGFGRPPRPAP